MTHSANGASPADRPAKPREENEKDQRIKELEEALRKIATGTEDLIAPYRALGLDQVRRIARQALSTSRGEKDSSNANPSPLDATRHSSDETLAPSGPHVCPTCGEEFRLAWLSGDPPEPYGDVCGCDDGGALAEAAAEKRAMDSEYRS